MELTSTASSRIALALLCGLFAVNVYRAATQSITTAEALEFDRRIRPPLRDILPHFDLGNHLLLTILIKRSVGLLRLSEFSMRLPSLLCGALYLWAVYRISWRTFGTSPLFVAAVALLSLNPLVLDALSSARAGGMALAFWMCSLLWMIDYFQSLRLRNLNLAGLCLGFSAATDPGFAVPAAGLTILFLIAAAVKRQLSWTVFTERLFATAAATAFVLLAIPLSHVESVNLDLGASVSVAHNLFEWPVDSRAKSLVEVLRRDAQGRHIRIVASPALAPVLAFYQARYRVANWEPIRQLPLNENFDYYVVCPQDAAILSERHLKVLYNNGKLLLARP